MSSTLLSLLLLLNADPAATDTPRKPNPLAPSLPQLTDAEEEKLDHVIERFIQFDIGKLKGEEGKKALKDFNDLGPEATFALIRGLNKSASIEATCPAATIGKKLVAIIRRSNDPELLDFCRENIGAGITKSPHLGILKDVRFTAQMRKRDVGNRPIARPVDPPKPDNPLAKVATKELASRAGSERGDKLKAVLTELEQRPGELVLPALGVATEHYESDVASHARELLVKHLGRQPVSALKEALKNDRAAVRGAAARAAEKYPQLGEELIALLDDKEADARQAARESLVKIAKGSDHGPARDASAADRAAAIKLWRAWWLKQAK